jgi:hypothetical protein
MQGIQHWLMAFKGDVSIDLLNHGMAMMPRFFLHSASRLCSRTGADLVQLYDLRVTGKNEK